MNIKAVVADVDETLLTSEGTFSDFSRKVIKEYLERGGHFILATGKLYGTIHFLCQELSLRSKQIVVNGAAVVDPMSLKTEILSELPLPVKESVMEVLETHGIEFVFFKPEGIYYQKGKARESNLNLLVQGGEEPPGSFDNYNMWNCKNTVKILSFIPEEEKEKEEIVRREVEDCCEQIEIIRTSAYFLEFLKEGTSKFSALEVLLRELGISLDEVAAFGDQENDRELVKRCGVGVAVANGADHVKEVADYITASNNEDGVARFIKKFILK